MTSKHNIWDFKKQKVLIGTFRGSYWGLGSPTKGRQSGLFHINEFKTGKMISVWAYQNIRIHLQYAYPGDIVRMEYQGEKKNPKYKNGKIYMFKVSVKKGERIEPPKKMPMTKGRVRGGKKSR